MLTANDLSKRFGDTLLFEHVCFTINAGDRIGLVGPNGSGKSTLLRILVGADSQDRGSFTITPDTSIGYLPQGFADIPDGVLGDLVDIPTAGLVSSHRILQQQTFNLANPDTDSDTSMIALEAASHRFDSLGGYTALDGLETLLDRVGLGDVDMDHQLDHLSGGQKTRAGLAALLSSRPDLLVLDEPTNHLDGEAMAWLRRFLEAYQGAILVVSHDRAFLDDVVTRIFAIDPTSRSLTAYAGNYSEFVATKRHQEDEIQAAWKRQQVEVAQIKRDIRAAETKARTIEASTVDYAVRKKAAKIARPAVVRKRKLERMLESEEAVAKPERRWGMSLNFADSSGGARDAIRLSNVRVDRGNLPVLREVDLLVRHGDRVALLGPNGSGKTTLMQVITGEITPVTGEVRVGSGVRTGYFAQEQQTLDPSMTVLAHARSAARLSESELRTFLHKFLFGGDSVNRCIRDLSYGERARLMLALLVLKGTTFLLLDEPLNHLDVDAREEFEQALAQFDGTTIMVLHDHYSVERLASRIIEIHGGRLKEVPVEARLWS